MTISYKIRHNINRKGESLLLLRIFIPSENKYFFRSTGVKLEPYFIDGSSHRVKPIHPDYLKLNSRIEEEIKELKRIISNLGEVTIHNIKQSYAAAVEVKLEPTFTFNDVFLKFVDYKVNVEKLSPRTIDGYLRTYKYFKYLTFETYTKKNILAMQSRLIQSHLSGSSIAQIFKNLKVFVNWSNLHEFSNLKIVKTDVRDNQKTKVSLNIEEIELLYSYSGFKKKRLEKIRDMFILLCTTGLRVSDLSSIKIQNLKNGVLTVTNSKTNFMVKIPLNKYSGAILEKYNYKTQAPNSTAMFNTDIKLICRVVGINDIIETVTVSKGIKTVELLQKWRLISSHTGRRTFITNSIRKGVSHEIIMKISGHRSYSSFYKYVQLEDEDVLGLNIF